MTNLAMVGVIFGLVLMITGAVVALPSEDMTRILVGVGLAWLGVGVIVTAGTVGEV